MPTRIGSGASGTVMLVVRGDLPDATALEHGLTVVTRNVSDF
jgi:hypothetical protein